jgi:nucleoid-associated protein YgaU
MRIGDERLSVDDQAGVPGTCKRQRDPPTRQVDQAAPGDRHSFGCAQLWRRLAVNRSVYPLGDWRAAAMAYNAGESRLRRALAKSASSEVSGERRQPAGMPNTTYAYIAKLRALACLISEPARYGLSLPAEAFSPFAPASVEPPSTNTASLSAQREHTVQSGDTLWDIARQYGTTVTKLASTNALRPNRPLRLGRVLRIPD